MTFSSQRLLIATLLAGLGATAMAQAPAAPATGEMPPGMAAGQPRGMRDPAQMQQRMAQRRAQHMADLKAQLKLTPAQEGAWTTFTAAMQPAPMGQRPNRAEFDNLTTPQRIDRMQALQAERQARMKQRSDAVKAFYAQLTPEQQKVFDSQSMRHGRGHGMHRGGMGMGPGMGAR